MTVFANGREISAKGQGCKVLAAFPDVCFTPPQTPATPPGVPLPYPNFGLDSDLASGSSTVKIGGKPVSLENKSHYSKCSGDEAGCAPKKGVVTSKNTGKVYAQAWSSDVKVEGKGVARFGDMATGNHSSNPGDGSINVIVGQPGVAVTPPPPNCGAGNHVETLHYPTPPAAEAYTNSRIASVRNNAANADDLFEAAAAQHNFDNGDLSRRSGHQISNGPSNGDQKVYAICTICGAKREVDHVTDNGIPCESKNKKSGFEADQKLNNQKFMKDNFKGNPSAKIKYKVPENVNSAAAKDLEKMGFEVVPIPGITK